MKKILCFAVLVLLFAVNTVQISSIGTSELNDWDEDTRLTVTDSRSIAPSIVIEGNNTYVVYSDNETGGKKDMFIWFTKSIDQGNTWTTPICINNTTPQRALAPKIAVNENIIHVIWLEYNDKKVHYIQSMDYGNTWSADKVISGNVYYYFINWDIVLYENNLHVIYIDSNNKLSYMQSNDNGNTWSYPKIIKPSLSGVIEMAIALEGINIHIAAHITKVTPGKIISDIIYLKSTDNGMTWDPEVNVSNVLGINTLSGDPDIAVSENNVFIVYREGSPGRKQIHYSYSRDNGNLWEKGIGLSNSTSFVNSPAIAMTNNYIGIVWDDFRNSSTGDFEIYFKISLDNGTTWSPDTRLTNAPEPSGPSDIAISENSVQVVWMDRRDGNEEIYYKHAIVGSKLISANVDINPNTLNLKSKGKWITCYIELKEEYTVWNIDVSTVKISKINDTNSNILAKSRPWEIGDHDNNGIPDLLVKFDRSDVIDIVNPGVTNITVTGELFNGIRFGGTDVILAIAPPK